MTDSDIRQAALGKKLWDVACEADPYPNAGSLEWSDEVQSALAAYVSGLVSTARREALEEAARECDDVQRRMGLINPGHVARAIREKAGKP